MSHQQKFAEWEANHGLTPAKRITIIGGPDRNMCRANGYKLQFDNESRLFICEFLQKIRTYAENPSDIKEFIVVCGGTKDGIPQIAAEEALKLGFPTVGVYPSRAEKKGMICDGLSLGIAIPPAFEESRWGDESPVLAEVGEIFLVFGGGPGTLIEVGLVMKANESRNKGSNRPWRHSWADPRLKAICPVYGTRGVAENPFHQLVDGDVRQRCMPSSVIFTAEDALRFLKAHLVDEEEGMLS